MLNKGQNLIEFLIIIAVVALGGILVLTLLGGNINTMFTKSSDNVAKFEPFGSKIPNENPSSTSSAPKTTGSGTVTSSITINGIPVDFMDDGSAVLVHNGQTVSIPANVIDSLNDVFETTGSEGLTTEMIEAITSLISNHQAEYTGDVPIEITFGSGARTQKEEIYDGTASVNTAVLTVDNHVVIIQKDQGCSEGPGGECDTPEVTERSGTYIIEGDIDGDQFTSSKITKKDTSTTISNFKGTIKDGIIKANYDYKTASDDTGCSSCSGNDSWDIDFSSNTQHTL